MASVDGRFQRVGAISNTHAGRAFQDAAQVFLAGIGLALEREFAVAVGHAIKKLHRFDLGSAAPLVLVECASYTWTSGGNSPSAKIRGLNEAVLLFSVAPAEYRKLLVMLRHLRRDESLRAIGCETTVISCHPVSKFGSSIRRAATGPACSAAEPPAYAIGR